MEGLGIHGLQSNLIFKTSATMLTRLQDDYHKIRCQLELTSYFRKTAILPSLVLLRRS